MPLTHIKPIIAILLSGAPVAAMILARTLAPRLPLLLPIGRLALR